MENQNPYKVFHSSCGLIRERLHVVLVRPEYGGNIGSTARALANMGFRGSFRIVGSKEKINSDARRMAKHAGDRLDNALFFPSLKEALEFDAPTLTLAATARIGSPHRPHPLRVDEAVTRALTKFRDGEAAEIVLVFGPEADGLMNEEVDLCDWIVTIPSSDEYRSLNLAQSVLIFAYEVNKQLIEAWPAMQAEGRSQRDRLVAHIVKLAESVGFILPGDPHKMRPRLEDILAQLPPHFKEVKTLHGLLDQAIRSVQAGKPDFKGRYRFEMEKQTGAPEVL